MPSPKEPPKTLADYHRLSVRQRLLRSGDGAEKMLQLGTFSPNDMNTMQGIARLHYTDYERARGLSVRLTKREFEILWLLKNNATRPEIAAFYNLGPKTVNTTITRMQSKLTADPEIMPYLEKRFIPYKSRVR